MELLYIWLLNFKNIEKQGFNFSSEYFFSLEDTPMDKVFDYQLIVTKNPEYVPAFFENTNITEVTGIIGQNGSGKSNVLDFIKKNLPDGNHSPDDIAIIAFRQHGELYLVQPENMRVKVRSGNIKLHLSKYPMKNLKDMQPEVNFHAISFIFYSNVFDLKRETPELTGFTNISTNMLLQKDFAEGSILTKYKDPIAPGNPDANAVDAHRNNEIRRNVQFLVSKKYRHLLEDIPLPEYLNFEVLKEDLNFLQQNKNPDVSQVLDNLYNLQFGETKEQTFKNMVYIAVYINLITTDREFSSPGGFIPLQEFKKDDTIISFIAEFFRELPNVKYKGRYSNTYFQRKSRAALAFFHMLDEIFLNTSFEVREADDAPYLTYRIDDENLTDLTRFLDQYIHTKGLTDFLDFSWRNLSSGEQSFLSFISRFYHLKVHDLQKDNLKNHIVIMIDEGDSYFHPEWQKQFFKRTKDFLSELFTGHQLQLIYTANTPFITSDLPKSNVIFIEKKGKRQIEVRHPVNNQRQTFGANIHTLFADSFYMSGAIMGDFAKEKIDTIINYLTGQEIREKDPNYLKIINQIGEPILKRKLQELWMERYGPSDEIQILEQRIAELKRKQDDQG